MLKNVRIKGAAQAALAITPAQALAAQVQVFPNPAAGRFHVLLPLLSGPAAQQPVALRLTNALGQTVLGRTLHASANRLLETDVDVRGLAAGIYYLRLTLGDAQITRKMVME